jgi:hypothetical protein
VWAHAIAAAAAAVLCLVCLELQQRSLQDGLQLLAPGLMLATHRPTSCCCSCIKPSRLQQAFNTPWLWLWLAAAAGGNAFGLLLLLLLLLALQSLKLSNSSIQQQLQLLYLHHVLLVVQLILTQLLLQLHQEVLLCCSNL